jgi:hypothetical protein
MAMCRVRIVCGGVVGGFWSANTTTTSVSPSIGKPTKGENKNEYDAHDNGGGYKSWNSQRSELGVLGKHSSG